MSDLPLIVSVDDHVVEPPGLFVDRLPKAYADRAPKVVRERLRFVVGTKGKEWVKDPEAAWCDAWHYEDAVMPLMWLHAAVGKEDVDVEVTCFDEIAPGAWKQSDRLADMDSNHVEAALCFPNLLRFAGQVFSERGDRDLSLHCIRAYNDWIIDEWGGGEGRGRLLPVTIVPLWDASLAADEIHRCAAKGSFLVTFPENPYPLGFPSLYEPEEYWSSFFRACEETETVVNMHIGSSSRMAHSTPNAPFIVDSTQTYVNSQGSLLDFIFSGTLERHPGLRISYSEGQVGWVPYVIERADQLWYERANNEFGSWIPKPPSQYIPDRVFFCIFDDPIGLRLRDVVGMAQITFETDYPHADSTFPETRETFERICDKASLDRSERAMLARGNAIRGFGLDRYGLTP